MIETSTCKEMIRKAGEFRDNPANQIYKSENYQRGFRIGRSFKDGFFLAVDSLDSGVLPKTFVNNGIFAPVETAVFDNILQRKNVKCKPYVIDVGVNIGYLSIKAVISGYKVIGFEPQTRLHDLLCLTKHINGIKDNSLHVLPFGLSSINSTVYQHDTKSWGKAHIRENIVIGKSSKNMKTIQVNRMDDIVKIHDNVQVQLLKIDCEGHELKVLQGAINILKEKRIKNIVIELNDNKIDIWQILSNQLGYDSFCWEEKYYDIEAINLALTSKLKIEDYGIFCGEALDCVAQKHLTDCWFYLS